MLLFETEIIDAIFFWVQNRLFSTSSPFLFLFSDFFPFFSFGSFFSFLLFLFSFVFFPFLATQQSTQIGYGISWSARAQETHLDAANDAQFMLIKYVKATIEPYRIRMDQVRASKFFRIQQNDLNAGTSVIYRPIAWSYIGLLLESFSFQAL